MINKKIIPWLYNKISQQNIPMSQIHTGSINHIAIHAGQQRTYSTELKT